MIRQFYLVVALSVSVAMGPPGNAQQQCANGRCYLPSTAIPSGQYLQGTVMSASTFQSCSQPYAQPYASYSIPAQMQTCSQPGYSQPVYAQPVYAQSVCAQQIYSQPVYSQPVYSQQVYSPPSYASCNTCSAPAYSQPTYVAILLVTTRSLKMLSLSLTSQTAIT